MTSEKHKKKLKVAGDMYLLALGQHYDLKTIEKIRKSREKIVIDYM